MWESIVLFFKNLFRFGGGKIVSQEEMEETIDEFQEKYNVDEDEIAPVFRNEDKSKWRDDKPDDITFDDESFDDGEDK